MSSDLVEIDLQLTWTKGPAYDKWLNLLVKMEKIFGARLAWMRSEDTAARLHVECVWQPSWDPAEEFQLPDVELTNSLIVSYFNAELSELFPTIRVDTKSCQIDTGKDSDRLLKLFFDIQLLPLNG